MPYVEYFFIYNVPSKLVCTKCLHISTTWEGDIGIIVTQSTHIEMRISYVNISYSHTDCSI